MPRNGLNKERIVDSAVVYIEQFGVEHFSMRALAESWNVKTASLYNHVQSMEALLLDVCLRALQMQRKSAQDAIAGKCGAQSIRALANADRRFAKEHRNLYQLIMQMLGTRAEQLDLTAQYIVEPYFHVLEERTLTPSEKIHWQRVLRGIVHGFISQEEAGFFSHLHVDVEESFQIAVECYIDGLTQAEKRNL